MEALISAGRSSHKVQLVRYTRSDTEDLSVSRYLGLDMYVWVTRRERKKLEVYSVLVCFYSIPRHLADQFQVDRICDYAGSIQLLSPKIRG